MRHAFVISFLQTCFSERQHQPPYTAAYIPAAIQGQPRPAENIFITDEENMEVVPKRKECSHAGCTKMLSHGTAATSSKAEFCPEHAEGDGVASRPPTTLDEYSTPFAAGRTTTKKYTPTKRKCAYPGCLKTPSYGDEGSKKAQFCSPHARPGMLNIVTKRCGRPACVKAARFGVQGSKKPEFCTSHAMAGMIDLVGKRCGHQGCLK